jgi:hypothetical protein
MVKRCEGLEKMWRALACIFLGLSAVAIVFESRIASSQDSIRSELLGRKGPNRGSFDSELNNIFQEAYNRGKADEAASSINIEVPSRRWLREEADHGRLPFKQTMLQAGLTKQEMFTAEEARNDMGGLLRLEAVNKNFAHRIDGMLGAIQNKLQHAQVATNPFMPQTPSAKQILKGVKPSTDKQWDSLLSQLDSKIVSSHHHHSWRIRMQDEARYENAFRKALDPLMRRGDRYRMKNLADPYGN